MGDQEKAFRPKEQSQEGERQSFDSNLFDGPFSFFLFKGDNLMKSKKWMDLRSKPFFAGILCSQTKEIEELPVPEAVSERIRLSYADPARCTQLLQLYGVTIGSPSAAIDTKKLPVIVPLPHQVS